MKINLDLENPYPGLNLISHSVFMVIDFYNGNYMDFYIIGHNSKNRILPAGFNYSVLVLGEYARKRDMD